LVFTTGQVGGLIVMTDRPDGFTDADMAKFETLAKVICPIMEASSAYDFARTIATTYIGPRSGARVIDGNITHGDVETLNAAIWFSDLFGWSRLANTMSPEDAVALANDYFEVVDNAVTGAGGEVLKLIGDAVLAIFPIDGDAGAACAAALAAARDARSNADAAGGAFTFGIGLHLGELAYGNVGSPSRLDFTVMGQAVNMSARIEKLTRSLDHSVVLSEAFATASGADCTDLGHHAVAGWDAPVRVFAPAAL
jgi:adenylate cyclase